MKKITYVGLERCDFVYHLANILSLQGKVLVVDNSYAADLMDAVSVDGSRDGREWRNIVYQTDVDISQTPSENLEEFAYVLVYTGMAFYDFMAKEVRGEDLEDCDFTLVMPDYTKANLDAMAKLPNTINNPIYILRDLCSKKFTNKSVAMLLGLHPKEIAGNIKFVDSDLASYVSLTHNHISNIKGLSDDMTEALAYVASQIFGGIDEKKMKKVMAAATKIK